MTTVKRAPGQMPAALPTVRPTLPSAQPASRAAAPMVRPTPRPLRARPSSRVTFAVLGVALAIGAAGWLDLHTFTGQTQALSVQTVYVREVQVAVESLSMVFAQADETVRAFQSGWLAPEGAASEFGFLHDQVKELRADIARAQPPADMEAFHRQLGRSVTLTQQAMDAMQAGFASGDQTYFDLAHEKLDEARTTLKRAVADI